MGFLNRLFGPPSTPAPALVTSHAAKDSTPVYPMIKAGAWGPLPYAEHHPFVTVDGKVELAVVFAQDAGENFEYLTPSDLENPAIHANFAKWQANIDAYPFELEVSQVLNKRVLFGSGEDHSSEKILSPAFLSQACQLLNTDRLIISIPRRRCLMLTSYYEEYSLLESFFQAHFRAWGEEEYGNELITEMVFLANAEQVQYAIPLGFRLTTMERDGQQHLLYTTMEDSLLAGGRINFQQIMETHKIPVTPPGYGSWPVA
jgi:hypothetical protein